MAVDAALLDGVRRGGGSPPTLRLHTWEQPCLSIGRFQIVDGPDAKPRLRSPVAIEVVRRPTGGRAILHQPGDVTYSLTAAEVDPHVGQDVMQSYRQINEALVGGLARLGIRSSTRERPPLWPSTNVGFACFETAYRHEIYWAGRKLVASAQRRRDGGFLQQGTIPGSDAGQDIALLLDLDPARRTVFKRELADRTGTLQRALDRLPTLDEMATALAAGFHDAWGIDLVPGTLTPEEDRVAAAWESARLVEAPTAR